MRVDDLVKLQTVQDSTGGSGDKRKVTGDAFTALLESEMNSAASSDATASVGAESVDPLLEARMTGQISLGSDAGLTAVDAVETGLKGLEEIGSSLSNGSVDARQVDALIQSLPASMDDMQKSLSGLPEGHPLKEIGNEISVTAYVESLKWKRGDYL